MNDGITYLKDLNEIVFVDTSTFINIEKSDFTSISKNAILKAFSIGKPLFISDLTAVELILGCRDENDLRMHLSTLTEFEFSVFGRFEQIKDLLEQEIIEKVISDKELGSYQMKIKSLRDECCFPYFENMFYTYLALAMLV